MFPCMCVSFLLAVFRSFHRTSLTPPWLIPIFFLYFILFNTIVNGIVFVVSFSTVRYYCIKVQLADFLVLILYHASLLNSFISLNRFWGGGSLEFSTYPSSAK